MMDPILEARLWWSIGIICVGFVLPLFVLAIRQVFFNKGVTGYQVAGYVLWVMLWISFGKELIPEEYDVKTEKVYQCEWVYKTVPKYPKID